MPSSTYEFFKYIIIIQIFFGVGSSMLSYAMPDPTYVAIVQPRFFQDPQDISKKMEDTMNSSITLPFRTDLVFLLFNMGNLIIDMLVNSIFAIPSMMTVLVKGLTEFIPIDPVLSSYLSLFVWMIIAIMYIIGVIMVIMSLRSQGTVSSVV